MFVAAFQHVSVAKGIAKLTSVSRSISVRYRTFSVRYRSFSVLSRSFSVLLGGPSEVSWVCVLRIVISSGILPKSLPIKVCKTKCYDIPRFLADC